MIMPLKEEYVLVPEGEASSQVCELPSGVVRVGDAALGSVRLIGAEGAGVSGAASGAGAHADAAGGGASAGAHADAAGSAGAGAGARSDSPAKVRIAVFDFDGTSLSGNSPVMLVRYLARLGMLKKSVIARIILWGGAYKARLPQNESWVRGLVFSAFRGRPVAQVNEFLRHFYDERVEGRFRAQADETMRAHVEAGHVVVCVSATFEPIIAQAMTRHPIHYAIATRMKVDAYGCYTTQVEGLPVEGSEKMAALGRFADARFGKGSWELGWAYGDHHSDRALLAAAQVGYAVTPDRPLARSARALGYEVLEWEDERA